jgi:replication factor C small subunit
MSMWTEKYRPKSLKDVIGQPEVVDRLKAFVGREGIQEMPHFLFAGPAGVGKTSTAIALGHEVLGKEFRTSFLELNASDERGINVVRQRIKDYARLAPAPNTPFRMILLDESDNMTSAAQQALRRTMETYGRTCRFILACNYSSSIISPIQSRCAIFRFKSLKKDDLSKYIKQICQNEGMDIDEDAIDAIFKASEGDLRQILNSLQAAASLGTHVDVDAVYNVVGRARPEQINAILAKTTKERNFAEGRKVLRELLYDLGLSGRDVLRQIYRAVSEGDLSPEQKIHILRTIGEVDSRITMGASEEIQLSVLLAEMTSISD